MMTRLCEQIVFHQLIKNDLTEMLEQFAEARITHVRDHTKLQQVRTQNNISSYDKITNAKQGGKKSHVDVKCLGNCRFLIR